MIGSVVLHLAHESSAMRHDGYVKRLSRREKTSQKAFFKILSGLGLQSADSISRIRKSSKQNRRTENKLRRTQLS